MTSRLMRSMRNDIIRVAMVATEPEKVQKEVILMIFEKCRKIGSRLVRSMRNDITRVALAATELETLQKRMFLMIFEKVVKLRLD